MKRVLIYSQDTLDAGDLRTMRGLVQRLVRSSGRLELRVISAGAAAARGASEWQGIRNITLPELRSTRGGRAKHGSSPMPLGAALQQRIQEIRETIEQFAPDMLLVDKLPLGLYDELAMILPELKQAGSDVKCVLMLRDLIGSPAQTTHQWRERGYFNAIAEHYEKVLVLGEREIFDLRSEYLMPEMAAAKLEYCGYAEVAPGRSARARVRRALKISDGQALVLVTAGDGRDGETLLRNFISGIQGLPEQRRPRAHIVCGAGMRESEHLWLACAAHALPQISFQHVSRDVMSLMAAADVVVATGGYQKTCELLTLQCRAVVVPSAAEALEQTRRAERLATLGLLHLVRNEGLEPAQLMAAVLAEILMAKAEVTPCFENSTRGLDSVTSTLLGLMELPIERDLPSFENTQPAGWPDSVYEDSPLNLRIPEETGTLLQGGPGALH